MVDTEQREVDELRQELESLKHQLASEKQQRSVRTRSTFGWILVVLAVLASILALLSLWTFRTMTNTELFVDRVGSIIEQPEVTEAIGQAAAVEITEALELEERIAEALPEELAIASAPIATAAESYLAEAATALVETEQFQAAWDAALAAGHELTIGVLEGTNTEVLQTSDGLIVLDITPIINLVLAESAEFLSDLLGREINPPTLTPEDIDAAVAALEEQLGQELPADFGQVVLFESEDLAAAQAGYSLVKTAVWLTPIAALILIALAIVVSPRRLRAGLSIVVGTALGMLLVGLSTSPLQESLLEAVPEQGLAPAVGAAFSTVIGSLLDAILVITVIGVVAAALLFLTGNSKAAADSRRLVAESPAVASRNQGVFLGVGAVVALILLALIPGRSFSQLLVVLVLYGGYALAVLLALKVADNVAESDAPAAEPPATA